MTRHVVHQCVEVQRGVCLVPGEVWGAVISLRGQLKVGAQENKQRSVCLGSGDTGFLGLETALYFGTQCPALLAN